MAPDSDSFGLVDVRKGILAVLDELVELPVDPSREFIALGGDSVRAMQVAARVRRRFGVTLRPDALLTAKSIEQAIATVTDVEESEARGGDGDSRPDAASRGQQQLWFVDSLGEEAGLYNISSAVHFSGECDVGLLAASIRASLAHESLRTVFREGNEGLSRVILPANSVELKVEDLRHRPPKETDDAYRLKASQISTERFSLSQGPVARAALVQRRDDLCTLVLATHHTALDAWSMGLLCEEIVARYTAHAKGVEFDPPPVEPYETFVRAEARGRTEHAERDLRWWRDYLSGAPTTLDLPSDQVRPQWQSYSGSRIGVELGDPSRLREMARRVVATPFTVMLAAFGLCLYRESGNRDLIIGIPFAGRDHPGLQDVVGFCAKLLPIRIVIGNDREPFARFARRLQNSVSMVLAHATVDLADLVRELALSGDPSRNPLVQVVFAKHDDLVPRVPTDSELRLDFEELDTGSSPVDLALLIETLDPSARASIEYATDVFSEQNAGRVGAAYSTVLDTVLGDPEAPLAEVSHRK